MGNTTSVDKNGKVIVFYKFSQNKKEEYTLVNGIKNGLYQSYYKSGQLFEEYNCLDGKMHGVYQMWHKNGQKAVERMYNAGKATGLYREYYWDGQLCREYNYHSDSGKAHGPYKIWYRSGILFESGFYNNGKKVGITPVDNNIDFNIFIKHGASLKAKEEGAKCGICFDPFTKSVVVASCCSLMICSGCLDNYSALTNCAQCRHSKPKTMTVELD